MWPEQVSVYILAGGKSSRMGEDKASMMYQGQPLLNRVLAVAQAISPSVYLLSSQASHQAFGITCIPDSIPDIGAAGGIDAMLHHSPTEKNILLSCDMPFVDVNSIEHLYSFSHNADIVVPLYRQYPEAVLGVYSSSCREVWRKHLLDKEYKLSKILNAFQVHYADGEELVRKNPRLFVNFNSPQDLEHETQ